MTKEVFKIRVNRSKRRREKLRSVMNTAYFMAWFGVLMPFVVYAMYLSRGCRMCIGGEWLIMPTFFALRYALRKIKNEWKQED